MSDQQNAFPAQAEIGLLDVLLVISENARLLVLGSIAAGLLAFGVTFLVPPTYTAVTRILTPQQQQGSAAMLASQLGALAGIAGASGMGVRNPADTYVALLKSRTVADSVIDRFDLITVYGQRYRKDARNILERATKTSAGRDGLITIEVDDNDPQRAADLANGYVDALSKLSGTLAITEAQQRRTFFEKQLQQGQVNLKNAELALIQVGAGESLLKSAPQALVEGIARLRAQVTALEIKIATMRGYLTESSPEYRLAERELNSLRAQLVQAERAQPSKTAGASDYLNRLRDFKYQETLFELMAKQYELARLDEAREGALIQVVDVAVRPERESGPRKVFVSVLTAVAAGVLLLIFVFMRRAWQMSARMTGGAEKINSIRRALKRLLFR